MQELSLGAADATPQGGSPAPARGGSRPTPGAAHAPPRGGSRRLGPPHPGASRPTLGRLTAVWTVPTLGLTVRPR